MKTERPPKYLYFKIRKERFEYLGNRYFRIDYNSDTALQICLSCGDVKKGKANNFGVYLISKMTLFSNYLAQNYCEPITKKEFDNKYKLMIKMLY